MGLTKEVCQVTFSDSNGRLSIDTIESSNKTVKDFQFPLIFAEVIKFPVCHPPKRLL